MVSEIKDESRKQKTDKAGVLQPYLGSFDPERIWKDKLLLGVLLT